MDEPCGCCFAVDRDRCAVSNFMRMLWGEQEALDEVSPILFIAGHETKVGSELTTMMADIMRRT